MDEYVNFRRHRRGIAAVMCRYIGGGSSSSQASTSSSTTNNPTDNSDRADNSDRRGANGGSYVSTAGGGGPAAGGNLDLSTFADNRDQSDNSDRRVDNRQDNSVSDAFNTTRTTTNTNTFTDNRDQSDNSDRRVDSRQDNRVITTTINSADAELVQRAYENLDAITRGQNSTLEHAYEGLARVVQSTNDTARASTFDSLTTMRGVNADSLTTLRQVNADSLLAQRDTSKDAFGLATQVFDRAVTAITGQTTKDIGFASEVLGKAFDQQKSESQNTTEKIIEVVKVVAVVGGLVLAARSLRKS